MNPQSLTVIDLNQNVNNNNKSINIPVALVNDHVVRMSVMMEPYFWHYHPDSDESFLVVEGSVFIDLEDQTIELFPNQLFTIPKNVKHRSRPNGTRSVNLTFETNNMTTISVEDPTL